LGLHTYGRAGTYNSHITCSVYALSGKKAKLRGGGYIEFSERKKMGGPNTVHYSGKGAGIFIYTYERGPTRIEIMGHL